MLPYGRDHPTTVKKRFCSVFMVMLISPAFIYVLLLANTTTSITIWQIMGFRTKGFIIALFVPLLLTATLFLGPICAIIINGVWKLYLEPVYWVDCFKNILWIRNHIVAPLSEEFTFRACMMPLLLQSYRSTTAVLLTPLFFGVAHLHHNIERVRSGMDWKTALIVSSELISIEFFSDFLVQFFFSMPFLTLNFSISVCVYGNIWHLFSVFICKNGPFYCTIHSARILQSYGLS